MFALLERALDVGDVVIVLMLIGVVAGSQDKAVGVQMLRRILLLIGSLGLSASLAQAQPPPARPIPEACRADAADALPELEKRRQILEREVARQSKTVEGSKTEDHSTQSEADARAKERRRALREKQEDLLEILFGIECARASDNSQPALETTSRSPFNRRGSKPARAGDVIEITTYYATNRKQAATTDSQEVYGSGIGSSLQYGRAVITIPPTHTPGKLELPSLWKLQRSTDATKHFVLQTVMPLGADAGLKRWPRGPVRHELEGFARFRAWFNMALPRPPYAMAQIGARSQLPGSGLLHSWPWPTRSGPTGRTKRWRGCQKVCSSS